MTFVLLLCRLLPPLSTDIALSRLIDSDILAFWGKSITITRRKYPSCDTFASNESLKSRVESRWAGSPFWM